MNIENLQKKYEVVFKESFENSDIIGLFLGGARGKSEEFLTRHSDMDVYMILSETAPKELEDKLKSYEEDGFEIRVWRLEFFKEYAKWGSKKAWDRYNFTHNKAVIDKTGEIQKIIDKKGVLPPDAQKAVVTEAIDAYINQVYRSAKYWRDSNELAAHLDAVESLSPLMTALYALEGRLKPFNKYFEWELKNYPLKILPWPPEEFIADIRKILGTGNWPTQAKIFKAVKQLFIEQGFAKVVDGWNNHYFVGD